ncbi:hypothetical protein I7F98_27805 [Sinorhizobium meliloti]|nr:hypothetical protein [Sinorhizobium meliloti]
MTAARAVSGLDDSFQRNSVVTFDTGWRLIGSFDEVDTADANTVGRRNTGLDNCLSMLSQSQVPVPATGIGSRGDQDDVHDLFRCCAAITDVHDPGLPASSIRAMLTSHDPIMWWMSDSRKSTPGLEDKP